MNRRAAAIATSLLALLAGCTSTPPKNSSQVEILGRKIQVHLPAGFCALGTTDEERTRLRLFKEKYVNKGELIQFSVPCSELNGSAHAKAFIFDQWAVVMAPVRKDTELTIDNRSLSEFLEGLGHQKIDLSKVNQRLQDEHRKHDEKNVISAAEYMGSDELAGYWLIRGTKQEDNKPERSVSGVMAMTISNGIKLLVQVYDSRDTPSKPGPIEIATQYIEVAHNNGQK
jgi:hypothetical protein